MEVHLFSPVPILFVMLGLSVSFGWIPLALAAGSMLASGIGRYLKGKQDNKQADTNYAAEKAAWDQKEQQRFNNCKQNAQFATEYFAGKGGKKGGPMSVNCMAPQPYTGAAPVKTNPWLSGLGVTQDSGSGKGDTAMSNLLANWSAAKAAGSGGSKPGVTPPSGGKDPSPGGAYTSMFEGGSMFGDDEEKKGW